MRAVLRDHDIVDLLACPRCRAAVVAEGEGKLRCSDVHCSIAAGTFPQAGGQPVLVDFDGSLLDREAVLRQSGASLIQRGTAGGARALAARLSGGRNLVAERRAQEIVNASGSRPSRILVVGGGTIGSGAEPLYASTTVSIIAFDIYASPATSFVADAHAIPLRDGTVDGVWIQAVLEHVLGPAAVVAEIRRVLKPGGWVYAETPFMQQVHEGPYDFTRFTHSGHRWLFREFEEIESGAVLGAGTQLLWAIEHFVRALFRSRAAGKAARLATFWLRWFDQLAGSPETLDAASSLYFYGRKTAGALDASSMPAYHRGADHVGTERL